MSLMMLMRTTGPVATSDADTGVLIDAESLAAAATDADTGVLADAESLTAAGTDGEVGALVEGETVGVAVSTSDTAAFAEAESVAIAAVVVSDGDTAGLVEAESANAATTDGDTASFVESESVAVTSTPVVVDADAASFTEAESVDRHTPYLPTLTSADMLAVAAGGGLSELTDDFPDVSLDPAKWTVDSGAVTVGDHLAMVAGPAVVESTRTYNARGGELVVRGARPDPDGPTVRASVQLVDPGGAVGIHLLDGAHLVLRVEHGGVADDLTVTYDPTRDVYWRIRESLGQVLMATSPTGDSGSWVTLRQQPHWLNLTAVRVILTASSDVTGAWGHGPWGHTPWGGG